MSSYPSSMKKARTTRAGPFTAKPDAATLVHNKVLSLLLKERPGLILDVPAGEGAFAASARKHGYEVQCGDIDPSRFKVDGIDCWQVDLNQRWPCDDELFDYVASIEAIGHPENPWTVVHTYSERFRDQIETQLSSLWVSELLPLYDRTTLRWT